MTLAIAGNSAGGYNITKSLRFRDNASAYLSKTFAASGDQQKFTISFWIKKGLSSYANYSAYFEARSGGTYMIAGTGNGDDTFSIADSTGMFVVSTAVYRDPAAWYHVVWAVDTTQATASNRVKLYINGSQVTAFSTATYPALNQNLSLNSSLPRYINQNVGYYFNAYYAEYIYVDGQQLPASSFGSFNTTTGVWQPAAYTGTYGTNGFYLPFTNTTSTTTLGYDFSGNGNNWTTNNISLTSDNTYDSMNDVPTLTSPTVANYPTLNAVWRGSYGGTLALSNGNLKAATVQANSDNDISATMAMPGTGKWYWEVTITGGAASPAGGTGYNLNITGLNRSGGVGWASKSGSPFSTTFTTNDVLGIAVDYSALTWYGYKNGVLAGSQAITTDAVLPDLYYYGNDGTGASMAINFGQQPFKYTPPTGFLAINSYNLPNSTIQAGNKYMDATLYSGNNTARSIANTAGFQPDFVWIKDRVNTASHALFDSNRGALDLLSSNNTNAAGTAVNTLTAFNSNGFALGSDTTYQIVNYSGSTYVGWQWQAGQGTTSTNTSGDISSTVSVNPSAGFSIVKWTSDGANAIKTMGHGLGVAPAFIIARRIDSTGGDWRVYHQNLSVPNARFLKLQSTDAEQNTGYNIWSTSSSTFGVYQGNIANNGNVCIAYCFAEIPGFSKIGKYTANGEASPYGPFVYTGFRPKFVLFKCATQASGWQISDSSRSPYNVSSAALFPNVSNAEYTIASDVGVDFLSNGFKLRGQGGETNYYAGANMIYIAFAENPFKNALAR